MALALPTINVTEHPINVCQVKSILVNVRTLIIAANPEINPIVAST